MKNNQVQRIIVLKIAEVNKLSIEHILCCFDLSQSTPIGILITLAQFYQSEIWNYWYVLLGRLPFVKEYLQLNNFSWWVCTMGIQIMLQAECSILLEINLHYLSVKKIIIKKLIKFPLKEFDVYIKKYVYIHQLFLLALVEHFINNDLMLIKPLPALSSHYRNFTDLKSCF